MDRKNIAAFTPPGANFPPYVSINDVGNGVEITVRAAAGADGSCGVSANMTLTYEQFSALMREVARYALRDGSHDGE